MRYSPSVRRGIWFIFLPLLFYCLCLLLLFAGFRGVGLFSHSFFCTFLYFILLLHISPFPITFPSFFSHFFPSIAVHQGHFTFFSFLLLPLLFPHGELFDSNIPALLPLTGITPSTHPLVWRVTEKKKDLISSGAYSIAKRRTEREFTREKNTPGLMPAACGAA